MLDFDLGLTEVPPSFQVGVPTSGGVPDDVSDCELGLTSEIKWNLTLDDYIFRVPCPTLI